MTPSLKMPFTKMQALGNDFVLLESQHLEAPLTSSHIQWIADRRRGIGCDQVILLTPSDTADVAVTFYNADGSKALACGNGTRCVAKYIGKDAGCIQTPSSLSFFEKRKDKISISLKEPTFGSPLSLSGSLLKGYPIDVGNTHVVIFTDNIEAHSLESLALSLQPSDGINVELAQVVSSQALKVKVWERGAGPTPACGSGACAVGLLSLKLGLIERSPVFIEMEGGVLDVEWTKGAPPLLIGPAFTCFKGIIDLP